MEGEVSGILEQFMSSSLVTWVKTFGQLGDKEGNALSEYTALIDGVFLNIVMNQINPKVAVHGLNKVNNDVGQRAQNLSVLVYHIKSYYQEFLHQLIMMPPPNLLLLGRNLVCEESLEEVRKLLLLLLGCAVQCEKKEEYIEKIQSLDFDTKASIAAHIQEVTHCQEYVIDMNWLETEVLCPEELENLCRNMTVNLRMLADQRDRQLEAIVELMQGKEAMKSPVFGSDSSLQEPASSRIPLSQQHLALELTDTKAKIKCLRQELEEKSEQFLDCRQDLDTMGAELKRLQQENLQLITDARTARMYRDELDAMKERSIRADKLESEVARYKEKLHNMNFYKVKMEELKEDNQMLMESKVLLEEQLQSIKIRFDKQQHLEKQNLQLETKVHDMEEERTANRKQIEELLERAVMLEFSHKRSLEESQRLGWELEIAKNPLQNSGTELKSLNQEVTENTYSRLLKLEKENQRLLKTLEEYKVKNQPLDELELERGGNERIDEWETAFSNIHNGRLITPTQETKKQFPNSVCVDSSLRSANGNIQFQEAELKDSEPMNQLNLNANCGQTANQGQGRENRHVVQQDTKIWDQVENQEASLDNSSLAVLKKQNGSLDKKLCLEKEKEKLIQPTEEDKKMLITLKEEVLDQRLKLQQKESDLEKCVYELERLKMNQRTQKGDHDAVEHGQCKQLNSEVESSLMKSLKIKKERMAAMEARLQESAQINQELRQDLKTLRQNYEALLQKSVKEKEEPCSSSERTWHRESPEATWVLLKVKDQLVEVERNNATLQAEKLSLQSQLKTLQTHSEGLQAQIVSLQQQTSSLQENNTTLQTHNAELQVEKSTVSSQNSSLVAHNAQLQQERQSSEVEREGAVREREDLRTVNELLLRDHERLSSLHERQAAELELLSHRYSTMESSHRTLEIEHRSLEDKYNTLLQQRAQLEGLEKALREDQQKMQIEICTNRNATSECQRLRDEKDWLNQSYQKLLAENEGLQAEQTSMKSQVKTMKLEQMQLRSELFEIEEQDQQLEMVIFKLTNRCELLTQLKGNLEEENRHLLDQIQSLMQQNQSLLDQTMENKDLFHMEQRQYIDKLNDLRRQKEKLEEKIMDQYRFYEPSPPRRRGNWIMLKLRKLMKARAREQEQNPSSDPQLYSESSEIPDDLKCQINGSFMCTQYSGESASDSQSPKRGSRSTLKIFPIKNEKPKDKESVESSVHRSQSMNDLLLSEGCGEGVSSQQEDQLARHTIHISQKHSSPSFHHFSSIDISSTFGNEGKHFEGDTVPSSLGANVQDNASLIGKSSRAPSASSGEFSVSFDNEAWSSDGSPLPDPFPFHRQRFNDSPASTRASHDELKQGCFSTRIGVQRTISGRSTGEERSTPKLDKASIRLSKTQSVQGPEFDSLPALDTQAKSASVSGCLNCFATPMRSPKTGQAPSTLPRASWVISTSEGISRRASVLSNMSGKSLASNSIKNCTDDPSNVDLKDGHVQVEEEEHKSELLIDSAFTIDSVFTNTIFS